MFKKLKSMVRMRNRVSMYKARTEAYTKNAGKTMMAQSDKIKRKHLTSLEKSIIQQTKTMQTYESTASELRKSLSFEREAVDLHTEGRKLLLKSIVKNKSLSKAEKFEKLKHQYQAGERVKVQMRLNSQTDILVLGVARGLIDILESEKYKGMVNSAVTQGAVNDDVDFFERTIKKAITVNSVLKGREMELLNEINEISNVKIDVARIMTMLKDENS